jgi:hypothetical protein
MAACAADTQRATAPALTAMDASRADAGRIRTPRIAFALQKDRAAGDGYGNAAASGRKKGKRYLDQLLGKNKTRAVSPRIRSGSS